LADAAFDTEGFCGHRGLGRKERIPVEITRVAKNSTPG